MGRHSVPQAGACYFARGAPRIAAGLILFAVAVPAELVPDSLIRAILAEVSAENALKETAAIAGRARYANSQGFFDAAEQVAERARGYGLQNVRIERFPAKTPMWDAVEAQLELVAPEARTLSTLAEEPLLLAQGSREGDVTGELADEEDDVKGKIALTEGSPQRVWKSLKERGALAALCAWQPEFFGRRPSRDAVAWGEAPGDALAFMISPKQGDELRGLMRRGPVTLRMRSRVKLVKPGEIGQVTGDIPGAIPGQDVVLAAHLDHQKQGANDNASGSGTMLEVMRVALRLIAEEKVPKPRRTLRFWWTTEIRSEEEYFRRHPDEAKRIALAVVLDQAGGARNVENNFLAILNPRWLPSYADDLIHDLGESVKDRYGAPEVEPSPLLVAEGGSKQSMRMVYFDYQPLSDHVAFSARSVGIPSISLAVPSLDFIHTNQDTVDRLDPTWLKRSALMALAPALYVAEAGEAEAKALMEEVFRRGAARLATAHDRPAQLASEVKRVRSAASLSKNLDSAAIEARLAAVARALAGSEPDQTR